MEYKYISEDEKIQIKESNIRNLEYLAYQVEIQIVAEKAKNAPDDEMVQYLENQLTEKQNQIAAIRQ